MGVDPDVPASQLIEAINSGNPGLDLPRDSCRIRTSFRERGGNITHVLEIDPASLRHVLSRPRLMVGWTVVRAVEDLHVPVCTYCSTYGHARRACPDKDDPSKVICTRCAQSHLHSTCGVRAGDEAVCCAECRRADLPSTHTAGHPDCPILRARVARMRARTDYGSDT
ncbi:hypothetical protein HPB49_016699 [Dermacentor silvarum]|uniref:Uncharacterized protein n=1 Tax=Dermacentor silvarum TaxID=543639 RepID=A0ACB8C4L4_DERSI|nr:hypothetical protein HPB49_016699 [Dermacentor silvarum]